MVFTLTYFAAVSFLNESCITCLSDFFIKIDSKSNHFDVQIYPFENVAPNNCNIKRDDAT